MLKPDRRLKLNAALWRRVKVADCKGVRCDGRDVDEVAEHCCEGVWQSTAAAFSADGTYDLACISQWFLEHCWEAPATAAAAAARRGAGTNRASNGIAVPSWVPAAEAVLLEWCYANDWHHAQCKPRRREPRRAHEPARNKNYMRLTC